MSVIRWGILGCGNVTEVKSGPALAAAEGSRVVAVMRRTASLAQDYARRHRVPRWYDDAEQLIHDDNVDAVYIAAPPGAHMDLALAVAASGKPAYVEKPMARSYTECRRMLTAFAAAEKPLFVAYYRRALPRFVKIKELLEMGRIGRPLSVSYRYSRPRGAIEGGKEPWRLDSVQAGGGLFLDLGCHTLDLFDWLFGPLGEVAGVAARAASSSPQPGGVEEVVAMHFKTGSGALGTGLWNFAAPIFEDEALVVGTAGRMAFSTFGDGPVRVWTKTSDGEKEDRFEIANPPHIQQPLIQTMVNELSGVTREKCPSTGESAARTSRVMDVVLAGYYGGRVDAFWSRPETWPGARR